MTRLQEWAQRIAGEMFTAYHREPWHGATLARNAAAAVLERETRAFVEDFAFRWKGATTEYLDASPTGPGAGPMPCPHCGSVDLHGQSFRPRCPPIIEPPKEGSEMASRLSDFVDRVTREMLAAYWTEPCDDLTLAATNARIVLAREVSAFFRDSKLSEDGTLRDIVCKWLVGYKYTLPPDQDVVTNLLDAIEAHLNASPAGPIAEPRHECPSCDLDDSVKVPPGKLLKSTPIKRPGAEPTPTHDPDCVSPLAGPADTQREARCMKCGTTAMRGATVCGACASAPQEAPRCGTCGWSPPLDPAGVKTVGHICTRPHPEAGK